MAGVLIHATSVHLPELGGVLLSGPPGSGKSDLALRLIDDGALLIADDQTALSVEKGVIVARAPSAIAGQLEVRGVGIVAVPTIAAAAIHAAFVLSAASEVERLPSPQAFTLPAGLPGGAAPIPAFRLAPFEASAPAKIRAVLSGLSVLIPKATGGTR